MKYKFPSLEKLNPGFHPARVGVFYEKSRYIFIDGVQGFINYLERHNPTTFFQVSSLLKFYIVLCAFKNDPNSRKRAQELYMALKSRAISPENKGYNARTKAICRLKNDFTIDQAKVCLEQIETILMQNGVEFFLVSGTLLGAVREGTFLSHDYDIDLGITLKNHQMEVLAIAFANHPDFSVRLTPPYRLLLKYKRKLSIDLFNHVEINGQYLHGAPDRFWTNKVFQLKKIPFLGKQYNAPEDTDLYLTENYGDWRTPQKDYNAFFDTPNILIPRNLYACLFFIKTMYFYYVGGDKDSLEKNFAYLDELILKLENQPLSVDFSFDVPWFDRKLKIR